VTVLSDLLIRATVRKILDNAESYPWSVQGLGMVRLYLSKEVRMHVWTPAAAVPEADAIHTHPWDFTSYVVCGEVRQFRYDETKIAGSGEPFKKIQIKCGEGGGPVGDPEEVSLKRGELESYGPGETYSQPSFHIHESFPTPGSVTLVTRVFSGDEEHANVYFRGTEWGSAEPRPATAFEVGAAARLALRRLNA
jgi:hypothetical protein